MEQRNQGSLLPTTSQNQSPMNTPNPRDKNQHIAMVVAQSYNVFNRYGKDSEALKDITRAFIEDLQPYTILEITDGFKLWRQMSDGMPAPANIIEQIKGSKEGSVDGALMSWSQFNNSGKSWEDYLFYLEKNGALSPNIIRTGRGYGLKKGYVPAALNQKRDRF